MNLRKRLSSSLQGHIVLSELLFSLPLFLVFLIQSHSEGSLTVKWALYLAMVWAAGGVLGGAIFWYAVSLPLIKGRQHDRHNKKRNE
jgi:hypothetical protein